MVKQTKTKIKELRELGFSFDEHTPVEEVNKAYEEMMDSSADLMIDENNTEEEVASEALGFEPTSMKEYSEIISLFNEDELDDKGNVYVHGLRRVATLVIGPTVDQDVRTQIIDSSNNMFGVLSVVKVTFLNRNENFGIVGSEVSFQDAADVLMGINATDSFGIYPTALSVTRAESRVLRKALRLNKCAAVEELSSAPDPSSQSSGSETPKNITDGQKHLIDIIHKRQEIKCGELGVDANYELQKNISELTNEEAKSYISYLNKKKKKVKK